MDPRNAMAHSVKAMVHSTVLAVIEQYVIKRQRFAAPESRSRCKPGLASYPGIGSSIHPGPMDFK